MKILALDTETGGLTPGKHSLLTVGAVYADIRQDGIEIISEHEYKVAHENYTVSLKAMEVNGLSLADFGNAWTLDAIWDDISRTAGHKPKIAMHNAPFDLAFLEGIPFGTSRQPRVLFDTLSMARILSSIGLPYGKQNLKSCCAYHGINWDDDSAHGALYDAKQCAFLLQAQLAIVRKGFTLDHEAFDANSEL